MADVHVEETPGRWMTPAEIKDGDSVTITMPDGTRHVMENVKVTHHLDGSYTVVPRG